MVVLLYRLFVVGCAFFSFTCLTIAIDLCVSRQALSGCGDVPRMAVGSLVECGSGLQLLLRALLYSTGTDAFAIAPQFRVC